MSSSDPAAYYEFAPAERPWRALSSEVAESLGLSAETCGDDGARYVVARRKPAAATAAATAAGVAAEGAAKKGAAHPRAQRPGAKLSDAPPSAVAAVVRLNTVKRDLRSIEDVQAVIRGAKKPREGGGGT